MKVTSIIDHQYKTGIGKTGKPWALAKVKLEDGREATGFGPIAVGQEVDLTYNEQYKNYSFKVVGPQEIPTQDVNADMGGSQTTPAPTAGTEIKEGGPATAPQNGHFLLITRKLTEMDEKLDKILLFTEPQLPKEITDAVDDMPEDFLR